MVVACPVDISSATSPAISSSPRRSPSTSDAMSPLVRSSVGAARRLAMKRCRYASAIWVWVSTFCRPFCSTLGSASARRFLDHSRKSWCPLSGMPSMRAMAVATIGEANSST